MNTLRVFSSLREAEVHHAREALFLPHARRLGDSIASGDIEWKRRQRRVDGWIAWLCVLAVPVLAYSIAIRTFA